MTQEKEPQVNGEPNGGESSFSGGPSDGARDRVIDAALRLAETRSWSRLSLTEIAEEAGLSLADLHRHFASKNEILESFFRSIDQATLAETERARGGTRDRLFDVIMSRFDALTPRREAILGILNDWRSNPVQALSMLPGFWNSLAWMLEAAGAPAWGLKGLLLRKGLAVVYVNAFRAWIDDDSPNLEKTMTALDAGLRYAERVAGMTGFAHENTTAQDIPEPS